MTLSPDPKVREEKRLMNSRVFAMDMKCYGLQSSKEPHCTCSCTLGSCSEALSTQSDRAETGQPAERICRQRYWWIAVEKDR